MAPLKRHQFGGPEVVQLIGLVILIGLINRYFGSGAHLHLTVAASAGFALGLFFLLWPMAMKARH